MGTFGVAVLKGENMERLTEKERNSDGTAISKENVVSKGMVTDYCSKIITKLADFEDLDEQGLLLKLPCKVCSTVYLISNRYTKCSKYGEEFEEYNCQGCEAEECDSRKEYFIHTNYSVSLEWIVRNISNFGKTVFMAQAEAEEALKKIGNGCEQ